MKNTTTFAVSTHATTFDARRTRTVGGDTYWQVVPRGWTTATRLCIRFETIETGLYHNVTLHAPEVGTPYVQGVVTTLFDAMVQLGLCKASRFASLSMKAFTPFSPGPQMQAGKYYHVSHRHAVLPEAEITFLFYTYGCTSFNVLSELYHTRACGHGCDNFLSRILPIFGGPAVENYLGGTRSPFWRSFRGSERRFTNCLWRDIYGENPPDMRSGGARPRVHTESDMSRALDIFEQFKGRCSMRVAWREHNYTMARDWVSRAPTVDTRDRRAFWQYVVNLYVTKIVRRANSGVFPQGALEYNAKGLGGIVVAIQVD